MFCPPVPGRNLGSLSGNFDWASTLDLTPSSVEGSAAVAESLTACVEPTNAVNTAQTQMDVVINRILTHIAIIKLGYLDGRPGFESVTSVGIGERAEDTTVTSQAGVELSGRCPRFRLLVLGSWVTLLPSLSKRFQVQKLFP